MNVEGQAKIVLKTQTHRVVTDALVVRDVNYGVLVSWHDLQSLGVISPSFPACLSTRLASVKEVLLAEFPSVFSDTLPDMPMNVEKMKIHTLEKVVPYQITTPRQIPQRYVSQANETLRNLISSKVITECHEPTDWCSPAFFVPKPGGKKVRLVTDYTRLNKFVQRPVHPFPSVKEIIQAIPAGTKFFAKLDAVHGYFQLELE
jgi:hypothetical protein